MEAAGLKDEALEQALAHDQARRQGPFAAAAPPEGEQQAQDEKNTAAVVPPPDPPPRLVVDATPPKQDNSNPSAPSTGDLGDVVIALEAHQALTAKRVVGSLLGAVQVLAQGLQGAAVKGTLSIGAAKDTLKLIQDLMAKANTADALGDKAVVRLSYAVDSNKA